MAFNIEAMKGQLQYGGARPTLFEVNITNTGSLSGLKLEKTPFLVHATSLPESNIGFFEVPYMGRKAQYAGDRTFQPWRVSVFNDEDFSIRRGMETWIDAIQGNVSNLRRAVNYKGQASCTQFTKAGGTSRVYNFVGLFPVTIDQIALDWNTTDSIETYDVTFKYDYWELVQDNLQ
jgi:hypothetical protein